MLRIGPVGARRCNLVIDKHLQEWLSQQPPEQVRAAFGIEAALWFARAIEWTCITELPDSAFAFSTSVNMPHLFPFQISGILREWVATDMHMELIRHARRIEIKIELLGPDKVRVTATYYQIAQFVIGRERLVFDIQSGNCHDPDTRISPTFLDSIHL